MISIFRDFTKSWAFKILMGVLVASFAVFGLHDVFSSAGGNNVVTAGRRVVSDGEFKQKFEQVKEQYASEHNGEALSNEDFVKSGQYVQMLNQLADQLALAAWFERQGIQPSAKLLVEQVTKEPAFQNTVTGRFDKTTYKAVLQRNGQTENTFERHVLDQIATVQYAQAAFAGIRPPRVFAATQAAFELQTRDLSYLVVSPQSVVLPGKPTDADVTKFYNDNRDRLTIPELRKASLVLFNTASVGSAQVDEETLKKAYQQQLDTLKTPELRTFVEVTAPDMNAAGAIAAALKAGQTPEAAAKAHNGKVLPFNAQPKGAVPDAKVGDAAFAMAAGDVSAPIQGDLAVAVVKMGEIKPGATPSYESVRAKLAEQAQKDKALDKLNQVTHAFADAMAAGEDFNATAQKLGLKIVDLPTFTAQGQAVDPKTGQPYMDARTGRPVDYSTYPGFTAVLRDIFQLQPGSASDVETLGEGQYFAVRLNAVQPAGPVPLDDALRARLAVAWQQQKVAALVEDKANEVVARLRKGEALEKVAADIKSPVQKTPGVTRQAAVQKVGPGVGGRIFAVKPGEPFQAQIAEVAFVVGKIDAVHQGSPEAANQLAASLGPQLANSFKQDIGATAPAAARSAIKTAIFPTTAARALDVAPPEGEAKTKDSGKKKS